MLTEKERDQLVSERAARFDPGRRPGKLSPEDRRALLLAYIAGESVTSIAKRHGVTNHTVKYHVDRAARAAP